MSDLSIVIPVYGSRDIVSHTVSEIREVLGEGPEIILVDDASPDGAWNVISEIAKRDPRAKALRLYKNHGQHHANLAGMAEATGDWVLTMDDDGQNPPAEVEKLLAASAEHDVVFGHFSAKQAAPLRRMGTRAVLALNRRIFGLPDGVRVSNFRLIRRDVVQRILDDRSAFPYVTGQAVLHAAAPTSVPVTHRPRTSGESTYTLGKLASLLANILFAYSVWPLRAMAAVGFAVAALAFVGGATYLTLAITGNIDVPGWATLVVTTSVLGGITIALLSMLGEYVIRILVQTRIGPSQPVVERVVADD